ncbi:MAG: hypothetical protein ACOCWR_11385, partial [Oceanidesulfovibrio sp.]
MTLPEKLATFFGNYLLEQGIIDHKELEEALAEQGRQCILLGDLAVVRGYLRQDDVDRVFEAQKDSDKPFGQLAVEYGLLTTDQLEDLLFIQNVRTPHLGEVLLVKGMIDERQFESVLSAYCREEQRGRETAEQVLASHPYSMVLRCLIRAIEAAFSRFMKERIKIHAVCGECQRDTFDVEFRFNLDFPSQQGKVCAVLLDLDFTREIAARLSGEHVDACKDECLAQCRGFMEVVERYLVANLGHMGVAPSAHRLQASFVEQSFLDDANT